MIIRQYRKLPNQATAPTRPNIAQNKISPHAIFYLTPTLMRTMLQSMMFRYHIEPVQMWGHEPCEGLAPSINTSVTARGVATRRTHPGLGAASSRSNVAEQFSPSYGRHMRRERETNYEFTEETSSATAHSSKAPLAVALYGYCLGCASSSFLASYLRSGLNATSKIAIGKSYV